MVTTLNYLIKDDRILLAEKKRGFGKGKINGVGGKLEVGESVEQAMIRETFEEIGVKPTRFEKVAVIIFEEYKDDEKFEYPCYVYLTTEWTGDLIESDEMKPMWFYKNRLPFDRMFADDKLWLERVIVGEKLKCKFCFDKEFNLTNYEIEKIRRLL